MHFLINSTLEFALITENSVNVNLWSLKVYTKSQLSTSKFRESMKRIAEALYILFDLSWFVLKLELLNFTLVLPVMYNPVIAGDLAIPSSYRKLLRNCMLVISMVVTFWKCAMFLGPWTPSIVISVIVRVLAFRM